MQSPYLFTREVDADGTFPQKVDRHLELVARDAADDNVTEGQNFFQTPARLVLDLVFTLPQTLTSVVQLNIVDVLGVDASAVVGQQGSQRSSDHLRPVDDCNGAAVEAVAVGQNGVVDLEVLKDLDNGEGRAREDALALLCVVEEADVAVHVGNVLMRQTLDVLVHIHDLLQVLVLARSKDRVVHHNAINAGVGVGAENGIFQILAVDFAELILEAAGHQNGSDLIHCYCGAWYRVSGAAGRQKEG